MLQRLQHKFFGKKDIGDRNFSANEDFEQFMRNNNCKFQVETDDDSQSKRYYFDYQGGHFVATTAKNGKGVDVTYPGFETVGIDELNLVRAMCNKFNAQSSLFKVVYTTETDDNTIRLHLSFFINVIVEDQLSEMLNACFYFQRSFIEEYENAKKNQTSWETDDIEKKFFDKAREQFLIASQEMRHENREEMRRHQGDKHLGLRNFLCMVFDDDTIDCTSLTIVRSDEREIIDDRDTAGNMPITSLLVIGDGENAILSHDQAVAVAKCTRMGDPVTITLTATEEGEDKSSLYMRISAGIMDPAPSRTNALKNKSERNRFVSTLVAYDKSSPKDKLAEFDFMWKDAILKINNGERLTEEEKLIVDITSPDVAYNIYWGEQHMLQERYVEALKHFENAFYAMRTSALDMNSRQREAFSELCYKIGFCHTELRHFDKAFYFLDLLCDNGNIRHNSELVNCLVNGKDVRAFNVIDGLIKTINEHIENDEDMNDNIVSFFNFLKRRKAYALIDFGKIQEAEEAFTAMLEEPENSDYALQELAYIQNLKKQQAPAEADSEKDTQSDTNTDTPKE